MDRNEKEKKGLKEWAYVHESKIYFQGIDQAKESYFTESEERAYIREYAFETLPQLMNELDELWKTDETMESVKKIIGVAAMKNKAAYNSKVVFSENRASVNQENEENQGRLPTYIYNF